MRQLSDLREMGEVLGLRRFIRFAHQSLRSCLRSHAGKPAFSVEMTLFFWGV